MSIYLSDTTSIPDTIQCDVAERLQQIEAEENVHIFLAVESGSRAWGFSSRDSDYDVRFLYIHSRDWYLSIDLESKRDVIERPINDLIDLSGWDLRKALQLLRKSNPPLMEWLASSLIYQQNNSIADRMRHLLTFCYSPQAARYHYLHMAERNYREYLKKEKVRAKKYFYALRPILAVQWIERESEPVPMEFQVLLNRLVEPGQLRDTIEELLLRKRKGEELDEEPRINILNNFIKSELDRLAESDTSLESASIHCDTTPLNDFFRWGVTEAEAYINHHNSPTE